MAKKRLLVTVSFNFKTPGRFLNDGLAVSLENPRCRGCCCSCCCFCSWQVQDNVQSVLVSLSPSSFPSLSPLPRRFGGELPSPSPASSAALLAARQTLRLPVALCMLDPSSIQIHRGLFYHVMCLFATSLSSCVNFLFSYSSLSPTHSFRVHPLSSSPCFPCTFTSFSCLPRASCALLSSSRSSLSLFSSCSSRSLLSSLFCSHSSQFLSALLNSSLLVALFLSAPGHFPPFRFLCALLCLLSSCFSSSCSSSCSFSSSLLSSSCF